MKFHSVLLFILLLSFQLKGQKNTRGGFFDDVIFSVGVSAGQETFIGLPKLSAYKEFPLLSKNQKSPSCGFHPYSIYIGADVSTFVLFAGVFTASANVGVAVGPVTLDNSVAFTVMSSPEGENSNYSTCNPKLGLMVGPVWLKAGPSFALSGNPDWGRWMKKNGTCYNVELHYLFPNRKSIPH
jgi:hypothetical protein